ncbi:hypothetical protein ACE2AJ_10460 [Aquihabitans daechungensis]|uniref:hypothetical protein n=1 Tax=Aquihabitans daechungensis TaxID=1052257 RepID=UPI003BA2F5B5
MAADDCETCRPGLVAQPVNALSSLAYVAAGADLLRRRHPDRTFAWAVIGVGLGSVAYHGPGGVAGKWAHDGSLIAMLGLMALSDVTTAEGHPMPPVAVGMVAATAAAAAHPVTTDAAQIATGALALAASARRFVRNTEVREAGVTLPLWSAGLVLQVLGRTGEAWCRPGSLLQPHAGWHVLSAAALWSRRRF